jgi:hypothetical protein
MGPILRIGENDKAPAMYRSPRSGGLPSKYFAPMTPKYSGPLQLGRLLKGQLYGDKGLRPQLLVAYVVVMY